MPTTKTVHVARRTVRYELPSYPTHDHPGGLAETKDLHPGTIIPDDFNPDTLRHLVETGYVVAYNVPVTTEGEQS